MLAKPLCCDSCRERKLVEIGIEMATRYQGEPFGLQRTLMSRKRQPERNARGRVPWSLQSRGPW